MMVAIAFAPVPIGEAVVMGRPLRCSGPDRCGEIILEDSVVNNGTGGIGRTHARTRVCILESGGPPMATVTNALTKVAVEKGWTDVQFDSDVSAVDAVLWVLSAVAGPSSDVRSDLLLARNANVPHLVVALKDVDKIDDPELLDLVELEIRELARRCGFPSDLPVVHLSGIEALNPSKRAMSGLLRLARALDECVAQRP